MDGRTMRVIAQYILEQRSLRHDRSSDRTDRGSSTDPTRQADSAGQQRSPSGDAGRSQNSTG